MIKTDRDGSLIERINLVDKALSKRQTLIADYLEAHYDKAAYMTALKLGEAVGVSESTVVRFAMALGYDGYPEMQAALRDAIKSRLTAMQRVDMTAQADEAELIHSVMKCDQHNIRQTIEGMDMRAMNEAVDRISGARRIFVLGLRSSAPLAQFMGYYLNLMAVNVQTVTSGVADVIEQIAHIGPGDLLVAISFPRYANRTLEAMGFAHKAGADILAITDEPSSPVAQRADLYVTARCRMVSFADSMAAPLSVINALVVAVGVRERERVTENFEKLEALWREYRVYLSREDE